LKRLAEETLDLFGIKVLLVKENDEKEDLEKIINRHLKKR
jgi:hypothetical protein